MRTEYGNLQLWLQKKKKKKKKMWAVKVAALNGIAPASLGPLKFANGPFKISIEGPRDPFNWSLWETLAMLHQQITRRQLCGVMKQLC